MRDLKVVPFKRSRKQCISHVNYVRTKRNSSSPASGNALRDSIVATLGDGPVEDAEFASAHDRDNLESREDAVNHVEGG